ncbi:hypothetical protein BAU01nite_24230 [Brevibacterium aurantiacum]|nr:hypothetical protein BAU01nite_24230 [Brevibacterium aurantiacum]
MCPIVLDGVDRDRIKIRSASLELSYLAVIEDPGFEELSERGSRGVVGSLASADTVREVPDGFLRRSEELQTIDHG